MSRRKGGGAPCPGSHLIDFMTAEKSKATRQSFRESPFKFPSGNRESYCHAFPIDNNARFESMSSCGALEGACKPSLRLLRAFQGNSDFSTQNSPATRLNFSSLILKRIYLILAYVFFFSFFPFWVIYVNAYLNGLFVTV